MNTNGCISEVKQLRGSVTDSIFTSFIKKKKKNLVKVLSVLQGLQVLQKTLRVPEGFLTDRAGGEGRSGGQLRKE